MITRGMTMSKILLYHGVTDWKKDSRDIGGCLNYNGKHIGVDDFEKQMKWLSENKNPHTTAIVTSNVAELVEGVEVVNTDEFLID